MVHRMLLALGLVALLAACTALPSSERTTYPRIEGIARHATAEEVVKVLGKPQMRETGYWRDSFIFDMDLEVWHYRGKGRVVFDAFSKTVYTSEADAPTQGVE